MTLAAALSLRQAGDHLGARLLLVELAARAPQDADVQYEAACVHDFLGLEAQAVPYYQAALAGALPADKQCSAYLGLGSTYRTFGQPCAGRGHLACRPDAVSAGP